METSLHSYGLLGTTQSCVAPKSICRSRCFFNGQAYSIRRNKPLLANTSTPIAKTNPSTTRPIECLELHHVGLLCKNLEKSLQFYQGVLGLELNPDRPEKKLPYRGAWLWVGSGMIHLMELPNPDPLTGRPEHGGRDRHACITIKNASALRDALDIAGIPYSASKSGRPAVFTRDP